MQYGLDLENVTGKNESARKHYTQLKMLNKRTYCPGEEQEWLASPAQYCLK